MPLAMLKEAFGQTMIRSVLSAEHADAGGAFGRFWPMKDVVTRLNSAVEIRWQIVTNHIVLATLMAACPASPGFCPAMSVFARSLKTPVSCEFVLVVALYAFFVLACLSEFALSAVVLL